MKTLKILGFILAGLQTFLSIMVLVLLFSTKMVPTGLGIVAAAVMVLLVGLVVVMTMKKKKGTRIAALIFSIVLSIIYIIGIYFLSITNKAINDVTGIKTQVDEINVYVAKDDPVSTINEAVENGYQFGIIATDDQDHIKETISKIETDLGQSVSTKEYDTVLEMMGAFEAGVIQSFITNTGTLVLLDNDENYVGSTSENFKIIMENTIKEEIAQEEEVASIYDDDHFCMYFSGIDTFGSVTARSRSDVNIIAVVNNQTKTVLLVSTPRDYYVPLSNSNGKKDKLTHAGIYGIDCSMETLEMLYEADLNYYVRINFSGFQTIIDKLGGIDVYSEYSFTSETEEGTYSFGQGINHLNGEQALGFARSRNFKDGDRQRGRNQMQVIKSTIEKLESTETLKNYSSIMDELDGSFQTDMGKDHIGYLVQSTLTDGNWTVLTYSVGGGDSTEVCYSLGTEAYVMVPSQADIDYANTIISKVLNGEGLTQDEINVYIEQKDAEDINNALYDEEPADDSSDSE